MSGTCLDVFGGISRFLIIMFAIVTARFSPLTTVLPHHQVEDRPDLNLSSPHYNAKSKPPDSVITSTHIFWISCIFFVLHSVIVCRSCIKIYSSSISIKVILYIFIIFNCQFFIFHLYFLTCSTCIPSPYYVHCYVLKHWSTFHVCATQLCKTPDSHSVWCLFIFPQEAASTTSRMFFSHLSPGRGMIDKAIYVS